MEMTPSQQFEQQNQPQAPQLRGNMRFMVSNGQHDGVLDEQTVLADLRHMGYTPMGVSADGMSISLQGPDGNAQEIPTRDVIGNMGWKVDGLAPSNADYDNVDWKLRAMIEGPSIRHDDTAKEGALKAHLQRRGIQEPQLIGSGSDWYVFNPGTSQWIALTNKPGADMSDLGEGIARAPGILAGGAGMAMAGLGGAVTGPGAIGAAAAGSAAGGFAGNRAADAALTAFYPEYGGALGGRGSGAVLKDWAGDAGEDALAGLAGGGLSKLGGVAAKALRGGLASPLAEGIGTAVGASGAAAESVGKFAQKGLARDVGAAIFDPTGMAGPAVLSQLPEQAVQAIPRAASWLGERPLVNNMAPSIAANLRAAARRMSTRTGGGETIGQKIAGLAGKEAEQQPLGAEEILGNIGDSVSKRIGRYRSDAAIGAGSGEFDDAVRLGGDRAVASRWQEPLDTAADSAARARGQMESAATFREADAAARAPDLAAPMRALGKGIGNAARLGRTVERGAGIPYDVGVRALRYGGQAAKMGGNALRELGRAAAPYEVPTALHYGSEELFKRLRQRQKALQAQGLGRRLDSEETLASL